MNRLAIVLFSILIAACSSNDTVELEPMDLADFDEIAELDEIWSEDIGAGQGETDIRLVPAISGDHIFASDVEGDVIALNRHNGDEIWETELDLNVSGGVGAASGLVLLGTYSGEVVALEQSDGSVRWSAQVNSEVLAAPQTNGDVVVVQTLDGKLYGLDANSGEQLWSYANSLPVLSLRGTAAPVMMGNTVLAGFSTGKVLALDARNGLLRWEQRIAVPQGRTELERVIDVEGSPLVVGDVIFAASYQGRVVAMSRGDGRPLWAQEASTHQYLAAGLGNVYLSSADDKVSAYQASNGQPKWENELMLRRHLTGPQTFGRYVAVADADGYVHVMDQGNGQFITREKVDGSGVSSPMISMGEVLYVLGNSGELAALKVVMDD